MEAKVQRPSLLTEAVLSQAIKLSREQGNFLPVSRLLSVAVSEENSAVMQQLINEGASFSMELHSDHHVALDNLARCTNPDFIENALQFCNEAEKQLYLQKKPQQDLLRAYNTPPQPMHAAVGNNISSSAAPSQITDPLSFEAIQAAIDINKRTGDIRLLNSLFAISVTKADTVKMQLIIGEIGDQFNFSCVIDDRGTTPIDFLAQCQDAKFIAMALIYCTPQEKQLYEQKKSGLKAQSPSAKISDKNFHKDSAQRAKAGSGNPAPAQQGSSRGCSLQ